MSVSSSVVRRVRFACSSAPLLGLLFRLAGAASAEEVTYDLTIARHTIQIAGKGVQAMTVNGTLPGPTLRFTEGDSAVIRVHNAMDVDASVHWHGVLLPNPDDGVPYVTTPPIEPGTTHEFRFPIIQSGTYWYHSHTRFQEEQGVYGSIVIEPGEPRRRADRDYVLVLSEWSDDKPGTTMRTLVRGSDWYALKKGQRQNLLGAFLNPGGLRGLWERNLRSMPQADISDVAYDAFLANGQPETDLEARPGETVRVRMIGASAATYYYVQFAGGPMTIIAADGQDVVPVEKDRFLISIAETYDILVTVPEGGAYELRATAQDGSGHSSLFIGSGPHRPAPDVPQPQIYNLVDFSVMPSPYWPWSKPMEMGSSSNEGDSTSAKGTDGSAKSGRDMGGDAMHDMASGSMAGMHDRKGMGGKTATADGGKAGRKEMEAAAPDEMRGMKMEGSGDRGASGMAGMEMIIPQAGRPGTPYADLRAVQSTALPADRPLREYDLTLGGDMERYVWTINGKVLSEADSLVVRRGENVRFKLHNQTMMHHPMHLHGHFFRVLNGQGDHAPLKHTVDIAPGKTTVIEFAADEDKDWFFHCHVLYHLKAGMARVVHYEGSELSPDLRDIRYKLYEDPIYAWADIALLSQMSDGAAVLHNTRNDVVAEWESDYTESYDVSLTYNRYINRLLRLQAGGNFVNERNRAIFGFRFLLPFSVGSSVWGATDGDVRVEIDREIILTERFSIFGSYEFNRLEVDEWIAGAEFVLNQPLSLVFQHHSEYGSGGGLLIHF